MAIDNKYGRVRFDEPNTIGEDEPVVVFRAADPLLLDVLRAYYQLCWDARTPDQHTGLIIDTTDKISKWQQAHPELVREKPTSSNWDGVNRV